MELISIGNSEVENILVLVATERSLDHELIACDEERGETDVFAG